MQVLRYDISVRVNVRYFAVVRERLGLEAETVEIPAGASVRGALDALGARHDVLARLRAHLRVAVNQEMVPLDTSTSQGR